MTKAKATPRSWRAEIGPGGRYVGITDGGLFWTETANVAGARVAQCSGAITGARPIDEIRDQLLGRLSREAYRLFATWGCITPRPFVDVLSARFFAAAADQMTRHDRISITAEAASARFTPCWWSIAAIVSAARWP